MATKLPVLRFKGLNTSGREVALPADQAVVAENLRLHKGQLEPREGTARLAGAGTDNKDLDFVAASSQYVVVTNPANAWTLKRHWTYRQIIEPDGVSGTQNIVGWNHATDWPFRLYLDGATLTWVVTDTADATTTLTGTVTAAKHAIHLERNGTALSMWIDGGTAADTDTMADLDCKVPSVDLYFGRHQTSNYYDGTLGGPELIDGAGLRTTDGLLRFGAGSAQSVRAWYYFQTANSIARDLSRYRNHGKLTNTPTEVTELNHQYAPILELASYKEQGEKRLLVQAGALPYIVGVE